MRLGCFYCVRARLCASAREENLLEMPCLSAYGAFRIGNPTAVLPYRLLSASF